jgi:hypothetical protein
MAEGESNTTKILLGIGCGCLSLVGLCCVSGGAVAFWQKSSNDSAAQAHAERFLGLAQQRDWAGASAAAEYDYGGSPTDTAALQSCLAATPLADLASFACSDVSSEWPTDDHGDVTCTITSSSQGSSDITVGVNSPTTTPYLGFVWFSPNAVTGPAWHSDSCSRWSGREFFRDPPSGRVRP